MSKKTEQVNNQVKTEPSFALKDIPWWLVSLIFTLTTSIFFWDQLAGNVFFWEDFLEYVYPVQSFAATESGIPFWNPYAFSGMPFIADLQVGFFYPLNRLLSLFVGSDQSLPVGALQFVIIIHFFIAQLSTYFLAKSWKISSFGAILSSVSFAFSFILVCHVFHPMMVNHLAWFPLVIMFFDKAIRKSSIESGIYSGLLLGMSMLSGHPQLTLFEFFFLGMMLLWNIGSKVKDKTFSSTNKLTYFISGIIPFIIAAGIFAIQILPSKELADLSQRKEITYEKAAEGSLQFKQLLTSVVPKLFGSSENQPVRDAQFMLKMNNANGQETLSPYFFYWETAYYFGIAALILGVLGAIMLWNTSRGAFLITMAIFGFLFALGSNFFVLDIFYNLPLFSSFRMPARMMMYVVLGFSMLAGFGLDGVIKHIGDAKFFKNILIAAAFPVLISLMTSLGIIPSIFDLPEQMIEVVKGYGVTAAFISISLLVLLVLIQKAKLKPMVGISIILLISFVDLTIQGSGFNKSKVDPVQFYSLPANIKTAFKPQLPSDIFRVNMRMYNPSYMALKRSQGMIDRIMLTEGYNPLVLAKIMPPSADRHELNDYLNVKYAIDIDQQSQSANFVENTNRFPHAWLVRDALVINTDEVKSYMDANKHDLHKLVVVEEDPNISLDKSETHNDKISCTEYLSNSATYKVELEKNAILVFSEIWYPAWKIFVDGKESKLLRANYSLRAVALEKGQHTVEMKYESSTFQTGSIITLLTLLASIGGIIFIRTRKK